VGNERLIEARRKTGLTQLQFAKHIGLKPRTYFAYERDERKPRGDNLSKICSELGLGADVFYPVTKSER
jgi:transcriptional regulator with XRE-family HTH domain